MPLMDHGGRPPTGEAESLEAALQPFKTGFLEWHARIDPSTWQRNPDTSPSADQWKRE
jgi:hypothetical protein